MIRSWLRDVAIHDQEYQAEVSIVVAELVANAMTHGDPPIQLHLWQLDHSIRVGIADGSSVVPKLRVVGVESSSGRGLRIVDDVASAWGTELTDRGKLVWADIPGARAPHLP